ncbi:putative ribonuclease H-like domain-containing protein [Tanacetum coccineum]|uniref:Ribonuclease H-like domain-containing protein n=1 Tax=Tanacetum coccineum TaxID=301880 RepID=A0ABQ5A0L8_9ASTR
MVKVIRCDNETEFKNKEMNQFCERKGIKREFSVARTPQQNGAEAVNTAWYVQNRVLVTKPHNKTLYELFLGRKLALGFMRPFGCLVTILNTIDQVGKFDGKVRMETLPGKDYILLPLWTADPPFSQSSKSYPDAGFKPSRDDEKSMELPDDLNMPELEDYSIFEDDEDVSAEADMNNLDTIIQVSLIPTIRIYKDHPLDQVIGDLQSAPQIRRMLKNLEAHGFASTIQQRTNHKDLQNYLFACFLSQEEPKKVIHALKDPSWIEAIQDELLQFKLQKVWTLVDLPNSKRPIGTKWVFKNKKDEKEIVIKNKARLVAQGYTQEKVIDYDEVFAPVTRIEAIRLLLAYALFKDFMVYQMDVNSAFLYGKIKEEVYVCQQLGFEDADFPKKVYKVEKALYGLHQTPRAWYETLLTYLLDKGFQRRKIDKTLFIRRIVSKAEGGGNFYQSRQDEDGKEVDVHLYRLMIGSLMYLTSSRPDIMFAMCACARYQVNPKVSHLHAVKRIFRYLKGQLKLSLRYPKDSPFDLVAYTDSDYAGGSLDRKSTTGCCQFLRSRLISWQCKK